MRHRGLKIKSPNTFFNQLKALILIKSQKCITFNKCIPKRQRITKTTEIPESRGITEG